MLRILPTFWTCSLDCPPLDLSACATCLLGSGPLLLLGPCTWFCLYLFETNKLNQLGPLSAFGFMPGSLTGRPSQIVNPADVDPLLTALVALELRFSALEKDLEQGNPRDRTVIERLEAAISKVSSQVRQLQERAPALPPAVNTPAVEDPTTAPSVSLAMSCSTIPGLAAPAKFSGDPGKCQAFFVQCRDTF